MTENNPQNDGGDYRFRVDGAAIPTNDRYMDGRTIRRLAGKNPPGDFALIQVRAFGTTSVGLDDQVDLAGAGAEEFRSFASDRVFAFELDQTGFEWGAPTITVALLREIARVGEDKAIILERTDQPDIVLDDGATIELATRGTERLKTAPRRVRVTYGPDNREFLLERREYTGAELLAVFGAPDGHMLDLVPPDAPFREIGRDEPLMVSDGMHFVSHPPEGSSS